MRFAVIQFPGSNCDYDVVYVLKNVLGVPTDLVWHKFFKGDVYDAVILPGGFSYGDYLRSGAIASHSPAMEEVKKIAEDGRPVLGICNGFQILIEAGLLPGALMPNDCLKFVCKWVTLKCETSRTAFTCMIPEGRLLHIPIAHREGRYFNTREELEKMRGNRQIVFRYVDEKGEVNSKANPNGSVENIASVCNVEGNVVGLMPHPERASEKVLSPYKDCDGILLFKSMVRFLKS